MAERSDIPFHRPLIDDDDVASVVEALRSGWVTTGPRTREFETEFSNLVGSRHAVAVNSCTAAMHMAVASLGLDAGDEVVTSPYTFVATSEIIMYTGAKPVFVDVREDDANIDPDAIAAAITPRTRGIMPIHVAGFPAKMDRIADIAQKHALWVVEDAAHAIETVYEGRHAGAWGTAGAFSFYPTKNITTAEGGMLVTDDEALADQARMLSLHGLSKDAWQRYETNGSWYYEVHAQGYKYNMTDVAAALGLSQMRKLDLWLERRRAYARTMTEALASNPALLTPVEPVGATSAWHLYPLRLRPGVLSIDRREFIERLGRLGVSASVHFIPLHLQPYFQERYGYRSGQFPRAEAYYEAEISLPLYPALTPSEVDRICESVLYVANESMA